MKLLWILLSLIAVERLIELVVSRRHQQALLERGGRLVADDGYRWLVALHLLWFPAIALEAMVGPWAGHWAGTWPLLAVYAGAEILRLWTISTLGERWTTRVVVVPGADPIQAGPYRWLDHPNYAAVAVELAVLPLAFGLPVTALVATLANGLALRHRIQVEEAALAQAAATSADA